MSIAVTLVDDDDEQLVEFLTKAAQSPDRFLAEQARAELLKVGPKGYEHGWVFVGVPGVGARIHHPEHGPGVVTRHNKKTMGARFDKGHEAAFEHAPETPDPGEHFVARAPAGRKPRAAAVAKPTGPKDLPAKQHDALRAIAGATGTGPDTKKLGLNNQTVAALVRGGYIQRTGSVNTFHAVMLTDKGHDYFDARDETGKIVDLTRELEKHHADLAEYRKPNSYASQRLIDITQQLIREKQGKIQRARKERYAGMAPAEPAKVEVPPIYTRSQLMPLQYRGNERRAHVYRAELYDRLTREQFDLLPPQRQAEIRADVHEIADSGATKTIRDSMGSRVSGVEADHVTVARRLRSRFGQPVEKPAVPAPIPVGPEPETTPDLDRRIVEAEARVKTTRERLARAQAAFDAAGRDPRADALREHFPLGTGGSGGGRRGSSDAQLRRYVEARKARDAAQSQNIRAEAKLKELTARRGAAGKYSRDTVKAGDAIKVKGSWERVLKANPKTVQIDAGRGMEVKYRWDQVTDHRPAGAKPALAAAERELTGATERAGALRERVGAAQRSGQTVPPSLVEDVINADERARRLQGRDATTPKPAPAAPAQPAPVAPSAPSPAQPRLGLPTRAPGSPAKRGDLVIVEETTSHHVTGEGGGYKQGTQFTLARVTSVSKDGKIKALEDLRYGGGPYKIPERDPRRRTMHTIPAAAVNVDAALATGRDNPWSHDPTKTGMPFRTMDEVAAALTPHLKGGSAMTATNIIDSRPLKDIPGNQLQAALSAAADNPELRTRIVAEMARRAGMARDKPRPPALPGVTPARARRAAPRPYQAPQNLEPGAEVFWSHTAADGTSMERTGRVWDTGPLIGGRDAVWVIPDFPMPGDQYSAILVSNSAGPRGRGQRDYLDRLRSSDDPTSPTGSATRAAARVAERHRTTGKAFTVRLLNKALIKASRRGTLPALLTKAA